MRGVWRLNFKQQPYTMDLEMVENEFSDPLQFWQGNGSGTGATALWSFLTTEDLLLSGSGLNYSLSPGFINDSNNDSLADNMGNENTFMLPWWRQLLWTVLFTGMVVVATGGNLIVIWIVLADRRMRTVTNYFLVNLSIADTLVSTLNVIFNFTYMLNGDWPYGRIYCKIVQFVAVLSVCGSIFTLMAISVERYMAIMHPLRPRMGKKLTLCIVIGTWVLGIILSLPQILYFTTDVVTYKSNHTRVICYGVWPDGYTMYSRLEYIYNVVIIVVIYCLPVIAMGVAYTLVGRELWGSQGIGENTDHQLDSIRSKRRVVKMMIVVLTIFAVCWLPYHVYFIVTSHVPDITFASYVQELYLAIYWLAMSNSMYNPIIYCWMNARFRKGFQRVFYFWFRCCKPNGEPYSRNGTLMTHYSCSGSPDAHSRINRNGTEITRLPGSNLSSNDRWGRGRDRSPIGRDSSECQLNSSVHHYAVCIQNNGCEPPTETPELCDYSSIKGRSILAKWKNGEALPQSVRTAC